MKISNAVLDVLSSAETNSVSVVLTGQLDRKLYVETNKVLEALGGRWNKKAKAHVFETDAAELIDQVILTGEVIIPKDELGFFPSPPAVVHKLIELAEIESGMRVLEPSAGTGNIALALADLGAQVDCVEINPKNCAKLREFPQLVQVIEADFLKLEFAGDGYDRIVMNPPFAKQTDLDHVLHAAKYLKRGGILVSVMSAGVTFRTNKKTQEFLQLVSKMNATFIDLPDESFKSSGTTVRTVILKIQRLF